MRSATLRAAQRVENRGDATSGIVCHTAGGACIYVPVASGEVKLFGRPITAYELTQPAALFNEHDRRRERWERRKAKRDEAS